jgi:hypothetical protein
MLRAYRCVDTDNLGEAVDVAIPRLPAQAALSAAANAMKVLS